ncbi:MAG: hypothetical protein JWR37_3627 [Mycobacterium sp.]|nr:hypothetical protein [Mycobacterium sp.]
MQEICRVGVVVALGAVLAGCSSRFGSHPATSTRPASKAPTALAPQSNDSNDLQISPWVTPVPTASPTQPAQPVLTPVTIDDWRYGVAWVGFGTDTGGTDNPTKPGQVRVSFTVELVATDTRRRSVPLPNSAWVNSNYGWVFQANTARARNAVCVPGDPCNRELHTGAGGCRKQQDDSDGYTLPPGGKIVLTCSDWSSFPDSIKPSDFSIGYVWKPCCSGSNATQHELRMRLQS